MLYNGLAQINDEKPGFSLFANVQEIVYHFQYEHHSRDVNTCFRGVSWVMILQYLQICAEVFDFFEGLSQLSLFLPAAALVMYIHIPVFESYLTFSEISLP